jgi:transcriptional regulator with XRE-family HTH domain
VQKYENGFNRVGFSRLARIAIALEVPVQSFFAGIMPHQGKPGPAESVGDMLGSPYALDMLKALSDIPNAKVRRALVALAESIATQKSSERRASFAHSASKTRVNALTARRRRA